MMGGMANRGRWMVWVLCALSLGMTAATCDGDDGGGDPVGDAGDQGDGGNPDGGGSPDGGGNPDGGGGLDAGSDAASGTDLFTVYPFSLEFAHSVGETSCPQIIGELMLSSTTDVNLTCLPTAHGDCASRIDFEPAGEATLFTQSMTSYGVYFNCSDTSAFSCDLEVRCADADETNVGSVLVPLTGNVTGG